MRSGRKREDKRDRVLFVCLYVYYIDTERRSISASQLLLVGLTCQRGCCFTNFGLFLKGVREAYIVVGGACSFFVERDGRGCEWWCDCGIGRSLFLVFSVQQGRDSVSIIGFWGGGFGEKTFFPFSSYGCDVSG